MTIDLHTESYSPFCRSVEVLAKRIGVQLNLVTVDLAKGEQKTAEYLKLNPFHTVPLLDDNGFKLFESRAIMAYLACEYAPEDSIYPKNLKQRALVDAMLSFDCGSLASLAQARLHALFKTGKDLGEMAKEHSKDLLKSLELHLSRNKYAVADNLTLADIAIAHTLTLLEMLEDLPAYTRVNEYYQQVKKDLEPAFSEVNQEPCEKLRAWFQTLKKE